MAEDRVRAPSIDFRMSFNDYRLRRSAGCHPATWGDARHSRNDEAIEPEDEESQQQEGFERVF
jgi:hypothetical protein